MMDTITSGAGTARASSRASRFALGMRLGLVASLAAGMTGQAIAAERQQAALGEPVNRYAADANVYALHEPGQIQAGHINGKVWLLAGQPGESNVVALVGDEGVLVVDTGVKEMAPQLAEQLQRLAREQAPNRLTNVRQTVRFIVNTNGAADHIGGNAVVRASGGQIIAGEAAATNNAFGAGGAAVWAHQNVLNRLIDETAAGGPDAPVQEQWPSDAVEQDVYGMHFSGEAVQLHHVRNANTDGQLMVHFRQADVIAAGDVLNMTSYPIIDVARGGTIDGQLVALNKLIDMIVPDDQVAGGTVVIPGHGRLTDLGDVARYTVMVTSIRNRVQYYKNQGRTLEQVLALRPSSEYDERWSAKSGLGTTREFITAVYNTLPSNGPVFFTMETATTVPATGPESEMRRF